MKKLNLNRIKKDLDINSSILEIKDFLFHDLKMDFPLDERKYNKKEEYIEFTKKKIDDLKYDISSGETINIENFIRYKICNKFGLNIYIHDNLDIDKTKEVREIINESFYIAMKTNGYEIERKDIIFDEKNDKFKVNIDNKIITLETDTMNSFITVFDNYLSIIFKDISNKGVGNQKTIYEEYSEVYKSDRSCPEKKQYRFTYYLDFISGKQTIHNKYFKDIINVNDDYKEATNLLNEFASLTHSIGNFILVPIGFNQKRYCISKDYWDGTINYINLLVNEKAKAEYYEENKESYKWYSNNYELFNMNMFFDDIKNKKVKILNDKENKEFSNIKELNKYLKTINTLIKLRGLNILETLNDELKCNQNFNDLKEELHDTLIQIEEN